MPLQQIDMRVSVIVPLYNKAPYVARAMESIQKQDYKGEIEIIVIDDGSADDGADIVESYRDPRLKLIRQKNAGPGAARNRGVEVARGEIITMLDADDEWMTDYISNAVRVLDGPGAQAAIVTRSMRLAPGTKCTSDTWKKAGLAQGIFQVSAQTDPYLLFVLLATMVPQSTVVRRSVFVELGGFYEKDRCRYSEDAHLWLKLLLRHPVYLDMNVGTIMHTDASALSANHTRVRPIEPFLTDPDDIFRYCPPELRHVAESVLARRALKTAAVYGYWGYRDQARDLMRHFVQSDGWRLPYFVPAVIGCTPAGGWIGAAARLVAGIRRRAQA